MQYIHPASSCPSSLNSQSRLRLETLPTTEQMPVERAIGHPPQMVVMHPMPSSPPPLRRRHIVPLPSLLPEGAPVPELHPILRADAPPLSNAWNMQAFPYHDADHEHIPWLEHPATYPPLRSMFIRVFDTTRNRESERPIIIVPGSEDHLDEGTVSVRCVLDAVHRFIALRRGNGSRPVVWKGLVDSTEEREVWILRNLTLPFSGLLSKTVARLWTFSFVVAAGTNSGACLGVYRHKSHLSRSVSTALTACSEYGVLDERPILVECGQCLKRPFGPQQQT
ncbi:hypothetical protein NMY22_g7840 [Coprinellus aureogranulatus]|nr:hypothetical protein NMY22_g7840 [Coprinellus aureogranulatus]